VSRHSRIRKTSGLVVLVIAGVVGMSAYAFTATNTNTDTTGSANVGASDFTFGPYDVSGVSYTFSDSGLKFTQVTFDLNSAATDVAVAVTAGTPTLKSQWVDCGAAVGLTHVVTCDLTTANTGAGVLSSTTDLNIAAVASGTVNLV